LLFDELLQRIHPAASRIQRLARETPSSYLAFDLLYEPTGTGRLLTHEPLHRRRSRLEQFVSALPSGSPVHLSPMTTDPRTADRWFRQLGSLGFDGVMAKRRDADYHSGDRTAMVKVKHLKTADCVVGGFRYAEGKPDQVGSLLLGLYDDAGLLQHVGHAAAFAARQRVELKSLLEPLRGGPGFTGRAPGGPSRWSTTRTGEWEPVRPTLVCEVQYDYFTQSRFRHGTKFLRWRPDKKPEMCSFAAVNAEGGVLRDTGVQAILSS
jgi:ATP-dependent DNA ligase